MVDLSSYELTITRLQAIHDMNLQETQHWNEEARKIGWGTLFLEKKKITITFSLLIKLFI